MPCCRIPISARYTTRSCRTKPPRPDAELQSQLDAQALPGFTRVQQVPETLLAVLPELAA
jgi:hypothetical protein